MISGDASWQSTLGTGYIESSRRGTSARLAAEFCWRAPPAPPFVHWTGESLIGSAGAGTNATCTVLLAAPTLAGMTVTLLVHSNLRLSAPASHSRGRRKFKLLAKSSRMGRRDAFGHATNSCPDGSGDTESLPL